MLSLFAALICHQTSYSGSKADISLISLNDIVSINKQILILTTIGKCDVNHIMMLPIKAIMWVLKVRQTFITGIASSLRGQAVILVIKYVETFKTIVILYIYMCNHPWKYVNYLFMQIQIYCFTVTVGEL